MSVSMTTRAFDPASDADWEAWISLKNAVHPDYKSTVAEAKSFEERREARCICVRCFGEAEGEIVGGFTYGQIPWVYHPDRYEAEVFVHPDRREQGYGGALYSQLLDETASRRSADALLARVREDRPRDVRFATERRFVETMREWESRLDVAAFDPEPWAEARARPAMHGIVIRTFSELASDPERNRKAWELENATGADVPSTEPFTPLTFENYEKMILQSPSLLPDAFMVAIEEATGKYVGSSNLWKRTLDKDLLTGLTGVLRDYRRMGIALAMKLRVIDYAKSVSAPVIRTENATTNRPMLSINEALGFVKQPVWILLTNELKPKPDAA